MPIRDNMIQRFQKESELYYGRVKADESDWCAFGMADAYADACKELKKPCTLSECAENIRKLMDAESINVEQHDGEMATYHTGKLNILKQISCEIEKMIF